MNLYELSMAYEQLDELFDSGEIDEQTYIDMLESMEYDLEDKLENVAKIIRNEEAKQQACKAEVDTLRTKQASSKNKVERLKSFAMYAMKKAGYKKVQAGAFTVSYQKNGGKRPLILDVQPEDLPKEFQKIIIDSDNDKIREFLENGGASELFHLAPQGESLRIK